MRGKLLPNLLKTAKRGMYMTLLIFLILLGNSALYAQGTGYIKGKITDAESGEALIGANVIIVGKHTGTATDSKGNFSISLAAGSYQVEASYIGYKPSTENVTIEAGKTVSQNFELKTDILGTDAVVVLGTYTTNRTVVNSTVPIDVITAKDIDNAGYTETRQMLKMLIPSFNAPENTITDGSDEVRPATLRGLDPDHVLVLINGKRRYTSALVHVNGSIGRGAVGVDLNAIPASAIERIEVLRDGASAQYGSDAIAGVINIILKDKRGLDADASIGGFSTTEPRGYSKSEADLSGQSTSSYTWDNGVNNVKINDGFSKAFHIGYGFAVNKTGTIYLSGVYSKNNPTNRAGLDPRQQYFNLPNGQPDPREATFNRLNHHWGDAVSENVGGFINGKIPLGNNLHFYTFGGYTYRTGAAGGFYRRALDDRDVRAIYPNGFLPTISTKIYDGQIVAGLKGLLSGWNYDVSQSFGGNTFNFNVIHSLNTSMGAASPTLFNAGSLKFYQATTNIDLVNQYDIGTSAPLTFAAGGEFRWENYKLVPGEPNSYINGGVPILDGPDSGKPAPIGSQVFPGFAPKNAQNHSRTNIGLYVNLENNLTAQWTLSAAGRFENYSDFGTTISGKLATRYAFTKAFAIRGAISNGFRAPALAQEYFSSIATNFIGGVPFEVGTFPVNTPVAKALGAKNLKAEKSVNTSGGFTLSSDNLSLTVDGYIIAIKDRIVLTENFRGSGVQNFLNNRGISATGGRYFTNAVSTRTQGVDVTAGYGVRLGKASTFKLTVAMNFNKTKITNKGDITTPSEIKAITTIPLLGRVAQGTIEDGQPTTSWNFMGNYSYNAWNLNVRVMRYGTFIIYQSDVSGNRDQTFSPVWTTDAEISYRFNKDISLAVGGNNLFDAYPDKVLKANSFNGIFQYTGYSPSGYNGRYIYTRVNFSM